MAQKVGEWSLEAVAARTNWTFVARYIERCVVPRWQWVVLQLDASEDVVVRQIERGLRDHGGCVATGIASGHLSANWAWGLS
jgi:hypothetical protein